ncbi:fimbria/pilus outer membrane usher protein [Enterobacter cloacae]|uniref:fimbria/pilus outer membrane usher protein n=1 Tax=Enterobacter cloacae TaxID=550 RepID=UPI00325BE8EC
MVLTVWSALFPAAVAAKNYVFDASQLGGNVSNADIALFNQGGQLPGTYTVDVLVNGEHVDSGDIVFRGRKTGQGNGNLAPCLSTEQLSRYGVKVEDFPGLAGGADESCADLSVIPQAQAEFLFSSQLLLLSIPQAAMRPKLRGIAPETLWDDGIPAFLMNYRLSNTQTEYRGLYSRRNNSQYAQLEPGMNLGAWRLRNSTTWQKSQGGPGRWQTSYTFAERGLNNMKSRLTLGERFTPSDIFDSVHFRGVMLGSDDAMVPASMRIFAPVVRGIARTQARVEVKQNGYTLYNATVAPGAFALTDLAATGAGGDLEVTVWETDGSPQVFTVPWQTPAIALKAGYLNYSVMAGQYRPSDNTVDTAAVGQATVMYGLPLNLTVYGGLQVAENYSATSLGLGVSLGRWGSLSLDGTQSDGQRKGGKNETGGSWRVRYSKSVEATNTSFSLASYQYASAGYNTLPEVLDSYHRGSSSQYGWDGSSRQRRKSLSTLTLSQSLGSLGNVNLNGSREDYHNRTGHRKSYGASYGTTVKNVTLSLNWTQNRSNHAGQQKNNTLSGVSISVPLDRWLGGGTRANYQMTSPSSGGSTQQAGLSGQAFDRQMSWNVSQSHRSGQGRGTDTSMARLGWSGGYGQLNGSYSYGATSRQTGVDAAGGMVISSEGMTLAQPLDMNNGVALVAAPGVSGVPVGGWPGVKTDFRGYTTLSFLTPYQENTVSLDPTRLPADAEITQTDVRVVPTKGAVTRAAFATHIGGRALISLKHPNGQALPFGALATLSSKAGGTSGIVGDGGQVYLTGLPDDGQLTVKWGEARECRADYCLPAKKAEAGLYITEAACR